MFQLILNIAWYSLFIICRSLLFLQNSWLEQNYVFSLCILLFLPFILLYIKFWFILLLNGILFFYVLQIPFKGRINQKPILFIALMHCSESQFHRFYSFLYSSSSNIEYYLDASCSIDGDFQLLNYRLTVFRS